MYHFSVGIEDYEPVSGSDPLALTHIDGYPACGIVDMVNLPAGKGYSNRHEDEKKKESRGSITPSSTPAGNRIRDKTS